MTVTRRTTGTGIAGLLEHIAKLAEGKCLVGVPKATNGNGNRSNAYIAMIHEFGLGHNPERSFLRSTMNEQHAKYADLLANTIPQAIANGMTAYDAYARLGTVASNDVKLKIVNGTFTPLSAKTIARKKSSKPLIDTGMLRQSISYEVRL